MVQTVYFDVLPISGAVLSESFVKTDTNCFIEMFALPLASVNKFPLEFSGAIPGSGYIHDCRNSWDTKRLFSRQPFPMSKSLYTRLPCIKYKSVIIHGNRFSYQNVYIHGCRA